MYSINILIDEGTMILTTAYWSPWIRIPAFIIVVIIFLGLVGYVLSFTSLNINRERKGKLTNSRVLGLFLIMHCAIVGLLAWTTAWNEERFVAAFALEFVAGTLHFGGLYGLAAGGIVGVMIFEKTDKRWLGWVVGILISIAVVGTLSVLSPKIPGVGWRFDRMFEESGNADYNYY